MKILGFLTFLSATTFLACAGGGEDAGASTDVGVAEVNDLARASGYDFDGPKVLPSDQTSTEICPEIVSAEEEACRAVDGEVRYVNGCGRLCSKPIAKRNQAAGYDFEGFKILDSDRAPVEFCAAVVSDVEAACFEAGGTLSRANGCASLCSTPIAPPGHVAGYDLEGFRILPTDSEPVFCPAVVSVVEMRCADVQGTTSRAAQCAVLCSHPL